MDSNTRPPECKSVALRLSHMTVVFDGMLLEFSPLLRLQPAAERNLITAFTHSDKGGWWVYEVRQFISHWRLTQVSYRRDRRTDRQTDGFIYIDISYNDMPMHPVCYNTMPRWFLKRLYIPTPTEQRIEERSQEAHWVGREGRRGDKLQAMDTLDLERTRTEMSRTRSVKMEDFSSKSSSQPMTEE